MKIKYRNANLTSKKILSKTEDVRVTVHSKFDFFCRVSPISTRLFFVISHVIGFENFWLIF